MNIIIYIISIFFAEGISFSMAGKSESTITGSAKMLGAALLSIILSIALIIVETIIFHL